MISAVFDTNLLVSAFLSRNNPGGVSNELLRFVIAGGISLFVSAEILDEVIETLLTSKRAQKAFRYSTDDVGQYHADLMTLASVVDDPPPIPGAVPRDPDDDMIVACAVAAGVSYLVTRDKDLLSLGDYDDFAIVSPEQFVHIVRADRGRLPQDKS
jgi:putative PIN family toxin of toxin-antitoxin system